MTKDKNISEKSHIKKWLRRRTLVYMANNAVGSRMWAKSFILDNDDRVHDLYEDGNLSCSYFISSILKTCELWNRSCVANVNSLVDGLSDCGWVEIKEPKIGAIIVYGDNQGSRAWNTKHVGIIVGDDEVVSNGSSNSRVIEKHPINYMKLGKMGDWRVIEGYWWHEDFEDDKLFYAEEEKFTRRETPGKNFV